MLRNNKIIIGLGIVIVGGLIILLSLGGGNLSNLRIPNPKLAKYNLGQKCNDDSDCRLSGCCDNRKCGTDPRGNCVQFCPPPKFPGLYNDNSCLCTFGKCRWTLDK